MIGLDSIGTGVMKVWKKVNKLWVDKEVESGLGYRKLDTGFVAHPIDIPGETKEHALTGEYYLQCDNQLVFSRIFLCI